MTRRDGETATGNTSTGNTSTAISASSPVHPTAPPAAPPTPTHPPTLQPYNYRISKSRIEFPSPTHLPNHNRTRPEQHNRLQISPLRNSLHSSVPSREIRLRSCHHANPTESPPPAPPRPPRAQCIPPTLYSSEWRRRPGHGERTGPCMKGRIQMEDFRHCNDVCGLPRLVPVLFYRRV